MGEAIDLFKRIRDCFHTEAEEAGKYSPLALAYIGDGIYEIVIRTLVLTRDGNEQVNKLHKKSSALVNAKAQARIICLIAEELNAEELRIYKRGRNAKSFTCAKNASIADYRRATGLEALCGYLYIQGKTDRLMEIIKLGITKLEKDGK